MDECGDGDEYSEDHRVSKVISELYDREDHVDPFRKEASALLVTSGPKSSDVSSVSGAASIPSGPDLLKIIDRLVAMELSNVSLQEREMAMEDVHGVASHVVESPEFLNRRLKEVMIHLEYMPTSKTTAYRLSIGQNKWYATDRDFQLMFLRADQYVPAAAAERIAAHFTLKRELFGDDKLSRDISIEDLEDDDVKYLKSGYLQQSALRDRAGRLIIFAKAVHQVKRTAQMRAQWFGLMSLIRNDVTTQVRGAIILAANTGDDKLIDHRIFQHKIVGLQAVPIRVAAAHFLVEDTSAIPGLLAARYHLEIAVRLRLRQYFGTLDNYRQELRRYGIPTEAFTMYGKAEELLIRRSNFIALNRAITNRIDGSQLMVRTSASARDGIPGVAPAGEASSPTAAQHQNQVGAVDIRQFAHGLKPNDFLLGKGKLQQKHPGNLFVNEQIRNASAVYAAAKRSEKTAIAEMILRSVIDSGGRFMKPIAGKKTGTEAIPFVEASYSSAKTKIEKLLSHAHKN